MISSGSARRVQSDEKVIDAYLGVSKVDMKRRIYSRYTTSRCPTAASRRSRASPSTVPEGKIVTLIGANGAGKSTILKTVSGIVRPKTGRILYNGEDITGKISG